MTRHDAKSHKKTFTGVLTARPVGLLGLSHTLHLLAADGQDVEIELDRVSRPLLEHLGLKVLIKGRLRARESGPSTLRVQSFQVERLSEGRIARVWDWFERPEGDSEPPPWSRGRCPWGEPTP